MAACFAGFCSVCFPRKNTTKCFALYCTMFCISISNTNEIKARIRGHVLEGAYCLPLTAPLLQIFGCACISNSKKLPKSAMVLSLKKIDVFRT